MKRALVIAVALTACAGGSGSGGMQSELFCADLREGLTLMNLYDGRDPGDFASLAYGNMAISCPEQLDKYAEYFADFNLVEN